MATNNTTAAAAVANYFTVLANPAAFVATPNAAQVATGAALKTLAAATITAQTPFVAMPVNVRNGGTQHVNNWPAAVAGFAGLFNLLQAQGIAAAAIYRSGKNGTTLWLNGWVNKAEIMVSVVKSGGFNVKVKQLQKAGGQVVHHQQNYPTFEAIAACPIVLGALVNSIALAQVPTATPAA